MSSLITLHTNQPVNPAELVWENPPERTSTGKYAAVARALRAHPGQWAVVRTLDTAHKKAGWSFSNGINTGTKLADFRADESGRFEARCRTVSGETRIYVRYVPAEPTQLAVAR